MAVALVEESLQFVFHSHAAHGDSLRTPSEAIVGGEHLRHSQHIVEIVHRLSLPHEHHIGQLLPFGQRIYLVQYVGSGEVTLETLLSGLAEEAVHLASHLRRHAERSPVAIGDIHRLHKLSACRGEEVFYRSVNRLLTVYRIHAAHLIAGFQLLPVSLR